jgi:hypothetical protein
MGRRRDWTPEEDERIRQLSAEGLSRHAIAVRLGCSDITVARRARVMEVPLVVRPKRAPSKPTPNGVQPAQIGD